MEEDGTRTKRYVISILLEQVIRSFVAEGGAIKSWHSLDTDFNNLIVPAASVEMVSTILELIGGHAEPINPT